MKARVQKFKDGSSLEYQRDGSVLVRENREASACVLSAADMQDRPAEGLRFLELQPAP